MTAGPTAPYRIRPSVVRDGLAGPCGAENGPVVYARLVLASGAARDGGSKSRCGGKSGTRAVADNTLTIKQKSTLPVGKTRQDKSLFRSLSDTYLPPLDVSSWKKFTKKSKLLWKRNAIGRCGAPREKCCASTSRECRIGSLSPLTICLLSGWCRPSGGLSGTAALPRPSPVSMAAARPTRKDGPPAAQAA